MLSSRRWPAAGALLLGGGFIVVGCAKAGPGEAPLASGADDGSFGVIDDGGGASDTNSSGTGSSGAGLNTPPASDMSGDDANGGSGDNAPAPDCDPTTCQSGCCQNGACASGMADDACGQGGVACTDCTGTNQVCSFGSCTAGNQSTPEPTDPGTGSSSGPSMPTRMMPAPMTSCGGTPCTNACFPLGLPCCTSAGACGCIALYFLPCQ
jgi:hypothetical protein